MILLLDERCQSLPRSDNGYYINYFNRLPGDASGCAKLARSGTRIKTNSDFESQKPFILPMRPTTGLDPMAAANVDRLIRSLSDDHGVTSIVVSHDLRSIFTVADRAAMICQGLIRLDGTPDDFRNTDDPVIHQFINGLSEGSLEL